MDGMKLYYFTLYDYDACEHYGAFAESKEEALAFIEKDIDKRWFPPGTAESHPEHHTPRHLEHLLHTAAKKKEDFRTNPDWNLTVFDVAPGALAI